MNWVSEYERLDGGKVQIVTIQDWANIGEIIGAAGVIASLVFVGWQIRTNTKTTRLHMHEQVTQTLLSLLSSVLQDPEAFNAGLRSKSSDFESLTEKQKMFFFATMLGFFKHYELMHVQYRHGVMDQDTWDAWSEHIRMYFHQPGAQAWWSLRKATFVPAFREYLESSAPPQMRSFVALIGDRNGV